MGPSLQRLLQLKAEAEDRLAELEKQGADATVLMNARHDVAGLSLSIAERRGRDAAELQHASDHPSVSPNQLFNALAEQRSGIFTQDNEFIMSAGVRLGHVAKTDVPDKHNTSRWSRLGVWLGVSK